MIQDTLQKIITSQTKTRNIWGNYSMAVIRHILTIEKGDICNGDFNDPPTPRNPKENHDKKYT